MSAYEPSAVETQDVAEVGDVSPVETSAQVESCDVCIVGAGLAGINALFVASRYLSRDQKVILVDRRERVGGMWVDTYPYVRLHQPHPMFTAGNIKWTLGQKPSYLATKGEVLGHFEHCLNEIKRRVRVDEFFGWTLESHDETGGMVRITCRSAAGQVRVVEAKRLIKAVGLRVEPNEPLEFSSARVQSVSPDYCDMRGGDIGASDTPVWVVGGGKTGMDTAHALITEYPGREVNLVAGSGTMFASRDRFYPSGARRWWGGTRLNKVASEMSRRYDGTNETEVAKWFRAKYGTWLTPETGNFLLGVLSESENKTIAAGLNDVIMDHVVDAVDRNGATELVFRSGATKSIQPGSWVVNCTGYLVRRDQDHDYEPYVSRSGAVVSIQPRSATLHLTSFMGYFMTHLLFLDKIHDLPLYELDMQDLRAKSQTALPYAMFSLAQHNLSLISDSVPTKVFLDCGLDLERWYPLPRRLVGTTQFLLTHRREREHQRKTLDTVRERFDVRCGPLLDASR
ncbi:MULTISPECIES: FAD-dependent oxidoreductase [Mycolicibacterium]|uniref:FAD-dependent oxidoreductase n=1 Tax=Mycolicibacterium gadium TaxID=1794 RepID=A0ABT6GZM6_MYCGU|nr:MULTISPECIES: FAD-dependent oxidoreductase [Mycolicibacterium]MDG5486956.1 FAD-dependent oxidoreductase [Mycolicibacterium gadium]